MGTFLRTLGVVVIAAWLVMLLALEAMDLQRMSWHRLLPVGGAALILLGFLVSAMGRAGQAVGRRRCVRCRRKVQAGQVYCSQHFHESVDRARDEQRERAS